MPSNPFDSFFNYLGGGSALGNVAQKVANTVLPSCHYCGATAYVAVPCVSCGHYSCVRHGFFRPDLSKSICAECAMSINEDAGVDEGYPWNVLQIPPAHTAEVVNRAFRKLAPKYHPDSCRNDPGAAEGFKALMVARDEALAIVKES